MPVLNIQDRETIKRELLAVVTATSRLSDVEEGSNLDREAAAFSDLLAAAHAEVLAAYRAMDHWNASGEDLDDRMSVFADTTIRTRLGASAAAGQALQATRSDTSAELLVSAGSLVVATDDGRQYVTTEDFTFAIGQATYPASGGDPVAVRSVATGSEVNAGPGEVSQVVTGPSDIISVTNTVGISGAADRETDDEWKRRADRYIAAVVGSSTRKALEFTALSYVSTTGVRVRHAVAVTSPRWPGYTELVVDDGQGLAGFTRAGATVGGTVPDNGVLRIWHEAPATEPVVAFDRDTGSGLASVALADTDGEPRWVSLHERGVVEFDDPGRNPLSAGDDWQISGYTVHTGIVAELQALIEGDPGDPTDRGSIAAGTRVVVRPPTVETLTMGFNLLVTAGFDVTAVRDAIKLAIIDFCRGLAPGSTIYRSRIDAVAHGLDGVDALLWDSESSPYYLPPERHPSAPLNKLLPTTATIIIT